MTAVAAPVVALALVAGAPAPPEHPPGLPELCPSDLLEGARWLYRPGAPTPGEAPPSDGFRPWPSGPLLTPESEPPDWTGEGWFRTRLRVPASLRGRPLGVFTSRVGALGLYANGVRIDDDPETPFDPAELEVEHLDLTAVFTATSPEVDLALRLATPDTLGAAVMGAGCGVVIEVCPALPALARRDAYFEPIRLIYGCFIGFTLALGLLHLFLHLNAREDRAGHLDYAVFTLATSALAVTILARTHGGSVAEVRSWTQAFLVSILVLACFGTRFFAGSTLGAEPRIRRWALPATVLAIALLAWPSVPAVYAFAIANLSIQGVLVIRVVRRRHPDRAIIAVGVAAMIAASTLQMAPELLGVGPPSNTAFIYGFVVLLLAMALHLARSVGRTHAELAGRIDEVERLSEANLAEQARSQEAALHRMALEAENRRQAERLEAAETRAALLDELTESHRKLRETQAQLVQSEKMASLGQLVAGVAHEMNTPIGAIYSAYGSLLSAVRRVRERLEALAPDSLADRRLGGALQVLEEGADVIARGSERVTRIVERLRTFARLDEAELQRADVHDGLEDTLVLAAHELKRGIEVVRDYGELPRIACFPGQLNQVFLNLIINARQAMGPKGRLTIRTRDAEDEVVIEVEDDGPGIRPEHLDRVFDPGFTTKGVGVGTGLGLAICYRIAEAHRGSLSVRSTFGQGATFTLRLPKDLERRLRPAEGG